MGNRYADHVTPLYPQKLALTSPTGGSRSVGMVRSRTEATEFSFSLIEYTVLPGKQIIRKIPSLIDFVPRHLVHSSWKV